jgi:collagenase-like PrtC family protease
MTHCGRRIRVASFLSRFRRRPQPNYMERFTQFVGNEGSTRVTVSLFCQLERGLESAGAGSIETFVHGASFSSGTKEGRSCLTERYYSRTKANDDIADDAARQAVELLTIRAVKSRIKLLGQLLPGVEVVWTQSEDQPASCSGVGIEAKGFEAAGR